MPATSTAVAVLALALLVVGSIVPTPSAAPEWTTLMGSAQPAANVLTLAQAAGLPPTVQDGLGPGSALRMGVDGIQSVCTASFLLRDPATATYFLSTAGHCLVRDAEDATPVTGAGSPAAAKNRIDICVDGCINNGLGLGTYVSLKPSGAYHPVAYAISGGIGEDFGIIELPPDLHHLLRPEMPQWGGPSAVATKPGGVGTLVAHYGHGTLVVPGVAAFVTRTPADQGRLGALAFVDAESFEALGHVTGGDSGSAASVAVLDPTGLARGTQALGVVTHSIVYVGAPLMSGTLLTKGLALAQQHTGMALELVPEGDPLPVAPTAQPAPINLTVTAPQAGAAIDLGSKRVTVHGTVAAEAGLPAGSAVQVAIDDPQYGVNSRLIVQGNTTWSATWDLAGEAVGQHIVRARIVDAEGTVLDETNVTVSLKKAGTAGSASSTGTAGSASTTGTTASRGSAGSKGATPTGGAPASAADSKGAAAGAPALSLPFALIVLAAVAVAARRRR